MIKGENSSIRDDITRYVYTTSGYIETFNSFVLSNIAKKNALFGVEHELAVVVRA